MFKKIKHLETSLIVKIFLVLLVIIGVVLYVKGNKQTPEEAIRARSDALININY